MPRPKTPLLRPEWIADAAIELVDAGEPFGVQAIAKRLGVTVSSLYNHVSGRDEIIELMRSRLDRGVFQPPQDVSWDEHLALVMRAQRRVYAEHPLIVPLITGTTITSPRVVAGYEGVARVLLAAGFSEGDALMVLSAMDSYSLGAGLDLASPDEVWRPEEPGSALSRVIAAEADPRQRSDRAFEFGMSILIDGFRRHLHST